MLNDYPDINLNNKKTIVDSLVDVAYDTILSSKEKTLTPHFPTSPLDNS